MTSEGASGISGDMNIAGESQGMKSETTTAISRETRNGMFKEYRGLQSLERSKTSSVGSVTLV